MFERRYDQANSGIRLQHRFALANLLLAIQRQANAVTLQTTAGVYADYHIGAVLDATDHRGQRTQTRGRVFELKRMRCAGAQAVRPTDIRHPGASTLEVLVVRVETIGIAT
ncbi:hypothetical protein D3C85_1448080 [compost metagenome]